MRGLNISMGSDSTVSKVPSELWNQLSQLILERTGLYFPKENWGDLELGVIKLMSELKVHDPKQCVEKILSLSSGTELIDLLIDQVVIRETYFYRDPHVFRELESRTFPDLLDLKSEQKSLKILSAGCCTGEEAYSLAIALMRSCSDLRDWRIKIYGVDINESFLLVAREGIYREWSFREKMPFLKNYFHSDGKGNYQLLPEIKEKVVFLQMNLNNPSSLLSLGLDSFDLIFCRNVFIYFGSKQVEKTVGSFYQLLNQTGLLFLGPSETVESQNLFKEYRDHGVSFYRKKTSEDQNQRYFEFSHFETPSFEPIFDFTSADVEHFEIPIQAINEPKKENNLDLALQYFNERKYSESEKIALSLAQYQASIEACLLLTRIYANRRNFEKALRWSSKAIYIDKLNSHAFYLHAMILLESGEHDKAVRALEKAIYINRNFIMPHFMMATLFLRRDQFKKAKRFIRNILLLLNHQDENEVIPFSDGMRVKQVRQIVELMIGEVKKGLKHE